MFNYKCLKLILTSFKSAKPNSFFYHLSKPKAMRRSYITHYFKKFENREYSTLDEINSTTPDAVLQVLGLTFTFDKNKGNMSSFLENERWIESVPMRVRRFAVIIHSWSHQMSSVIGLAVNKQRSYATKSHTIIDYLAFKADFGDFDDFEIELSKLLMSNSSLSILMHHSNLKRLELLIDEHQSNPNDTVHYALHDYYAQLIGHMVVVSTVSNILELYCDQLSKVNLALKYVLTVALDNIPDGIKASLQIFTVRLLDGFNKYLSANEQNISFFDDHQVVAMVKFLSNRGGLLFDLGRAISLSASATPLVPIPKDQRSQKDPIKANMLPGYYEAYNIIYSDDDCFSTSILQSWFKL
jgi:hypothetical protein